MLRVGLRCLREVAERATLPAGSGGQRCFSEETKGRWGSARHLQALDAAAAHLDHGDLQLNRYRAGELLAEELRLAHEQLGEITGRISADDLLGRIFGSFCIGK